MKYLPWMSMVLVVSQLAACGGDDDSASDDGKAGSASTAGTSAKGGSSPGASGSSSNAGSSNAGAGGAAAGAGGASQGGSVAEGGVGGEATQLADIVDTAVAAGTFKQLAAALTKAGLVEALKGKGPFTVFAPDDQAFDAFEAANPGVLGKLSKEELAAILQYHVVAGAAVKAASLKDGEVFVTLNGSPVLIDTTAGVTVDDAKVKTADVVATNGVIHVIDKIILPPKDDIVATAVAAGNFTKLASALTSAGLVPELQKPGPFTVFAPTDAAFGKLASVPTGEALKNLLLYHVVSGAVGSGDLKAGKVPTLLTGKSVTVALAPAITVDGAKVTTANILAKNGVIHVIDTVLVPE